MPKIVDHDERRNHASRALWQVLSRDGVDAVSIRTVAAEAGMKASTLQHYFTDRAQMLNRSLELVIEQQKARLDARELPADPVQLVYELWRQTLPLDDERRLESEVWLAATVGLKDPTFRTVLDSADRALHELCRWTVDVLGGSPDDAEALRLFTDGLVLNAVCYPSRFSAERQTWSLDKFLDQISDGG
ncbi:MAG: TetR/AcrR family transcriptional regulator [Rhodococcus sp. (in: high G+C Gram-positive bacteria)]|uniref:TetR/AcrR family transcriptional regulator n=1 Tax=Rhodococcus sp. TaxID=1831 RepID=UPI002ADBB57B|nr:TetR/AcrR family transcriptional regulator [Rhodococcus sp. (in: high G+C Gram-positive bacteria)]